MEKVVAVVFALVALVHIGCTGTSGPGGQRLRVKVDRPDLPIAAASDLELASFKDGDALFEATIRESDGLGPLYIRDSCAACHRNDGRGPGFVRKLISRRPVGAAARASLFPFGTTERPFVAAGARQPVLAVANETVSFVRRLPPAVFGRGYIEAISSQEIERIAKAASARVGTARGRPNRLQDGSIGRFGVKARLATLDEFTADALNGDMGITTPLRRTEQLGPEGLSDDEKPGLDFPAERVQRISEYVRLLDIPRRAAQSAEGAELFAMAGCATCHVVSLHTDLRFPVRALADVEAPIYSDLLLHDMGEALSDGQYEGDALPREFRTAPLIGLRYLPNLLHDGRARNVAEAIDAHGAEDSEAHDSFVLYRALKPSARDVLLKFVDSL